MTLRHILTTLVISSLAIAASTSVSAQEIYRWVDENGVVNFSQKVPPEDVENVSTVTVEDSKAREQDPEEDPFNIAATAARTQALREEMAERREKSREERLERERIAAQQRVVHYQQPSYHGYRYVPPWFGNRPIQPLPPIDPHPPIPEPYPIVPFRPPSQ